MVIVFEKFSKHSLVTYNVLRTLIDDMDTTEAADVLVRKIPGKHLHKMILVPETTSSILKLRGQKEDQSREPNHFSEFLLDFLSLALSACFAASLALFHFWVKFFLLEKPLNPLAFPPIYLDLPTWFLTLDYTD